MKRYDRLKEFVDSELNDYSYFEGYDIELEEQYNDYDYYTLNLKLCNSPRFKVSDSKIYIELAEDCWEETTDFDYRIKYFWMAILKWE